MFYFSNSVPSHSSTTCTSSDVANSDEIENEEESCLSAADAQMHTSPRPSVNSCPSPQTIINQDQESLGSHGEVILARYITGFIALTILFT